MKIIKTKFKDLRLIKHKKFSDHRGFLKFNFNKKIINWDNFVFDYIAHSKKNVFRGFHFQTKNKQSKYVNVLKGKILDIVIDLRKKSKTFGKYFKIILSSENAISLFIPKGFAHAYFSYENDNIIYYKLDNFYKPKYESGIIYNDKIIKVKWPKRKTILSPKDKNLKTFKDFTKSYKFL